MCVPEDQVRKKFTFFFLSSSLKVQEHENLHKKKSNLFYYYKNSCESIENTSGRHKKNIYIRNGAKHEIHSISRVFETKLVCRTEKRIKILFSFFLSFRFFLLFFIISV